MEIYQPIISGSLTVSGSVQVIGPFTMSGGSITGTASFAQNSGLLSNLDSGSFVGTGSFNTMSSSVSTRVTKIEGNYATTGSNVFTGAQTVCANITSTGTIIAQTLNVQQVTSSIVYSSGSNIFGCSLTNTQQFTGSVTMTGSLIVTTTAPELTVGATGVTLGNVLTDVHNVTGSLRITGSNALFSVGCVGIGTTTPNALIQIGNGSIGHTLSRGYLTLVGDAGWNYISFYSGSTYKSYIGYDSNGNNLWTSSDGCPISLLNAKVGIGTQCPSEALHLYGTGTSPRPALFIETCNASATPEIRLFQTSGRSVLMNLQTNGDLSIQNSTNNSSYNTRKWRKYRYRYKYSVC